MPHCQLCLHESPNHAPFCPVATGALVQGGQGFQAVTPQAFDIQALQAQISELRERVRLLELALDALSKKGGAR